MMLLINLEFALLALSALIFGCKTSEPSQPPEQIHAEAQATDGALPEQEVMVDAKVDVLTAPSPRAEVQPAAKLNLSDNCASDIRCPPGLAPVRCWAVEIGGDFRIEIDSAPNHCSGMGRLAEKLCVNGRKFSDFHAICELKSR